LDLVPPAAAVGRFWLRNIYLAHLGDDQDNWQRCFAADRWITDRNNDCRRPYWPGCGREQTEVGLEERTSESAGWCLVAYRAVARPAEHDGP
jgi:hypothetical protein